MDSAKKNDWTSSAETRYDRSSFYCPKCSTALQVRETRQTHISEEDQRRIDDMIMKYRQEASDSKQKQEELHAELNTTRKELESVSGEKEALRIANQLHEEEFHSERRERKRAEDELRRVRAQLQQLEQRQWLEQPSHHWPSHPGRCMPIGLDVCDSSTSSSVGAAETVQGHTSRTISSSHDIAAVPQQSPVACSETSDTRTNLSKLPALSADQNDLP